MNAKDIYLIYEPMAAAMVLVLTSWNQRKYDY